MATQLEKTDKPEQSGDLTVFPALEIDWDRYGEMLQECDLTDVQKREFLQALWYSMVAFVDLGIKIPPLQQACEQNRIPVEILTPDSSDVVSSNHSPKTEFLTAADGSPFASQKGSRK